MVWIHLWKLFPSELFLSHSQFIDYFCQHIKFWMLPVHYGKMISFVYLELFTCRGTLSWGSRSSSASNAWGTSSVSPNTGGGTTSPSYLSGHISSESGTRPSTAGSDKSHEPTSNAWGPNSRPSSASGVLTSNQTSLASLRPRSAEPRPGSSQLSRFAEHSEHPVAWSAPGTAEKLVFSSIPFQSTNFISLVSIMKNRFGHSMHFT